MKKGEDHRAAETVPVVPTHGGDFDVRTKKS